MCDLRVFFFRYLHRNDAELDSLLEPQCEKKHTGRHYRLQFAPREDALRSGMVKERELFQGPGFGQWVCTTSHSV